MQYIMYKGVMMPADKVVQLKNKGSVLLTEDLNVEEVKKEEPAEEIIIDSEVETAETPVMTIEEMKIKLDEAGVSYHHASGLPKLTELMKENNLM